MRLIDADNLIKELRKSTELLHGNTLVPANLLRTFIEKTPTVYNVDKVVEQLEKEKEQSYYYSTLKGGRANGKSIVYGKNLAYQRAIEIVKAGGKYE